LILKTSPEHRELKFIAKNCVTRHHVYHYLHFANTQWELLEKQRPPTIKALLYVCRVLLTGTHLMQTGEVEANLRNLNQMFRLPYVDDLILRKTMSSETGELAKSDVAFQRNQFERLRAGLQEAHEKSHLPEAPSCRRELHDLLIQVRTNFMSSKTGALRPGA
jgi:predicted nucleotidyltransferase